MAAGVSDLGWRSSAASMMFDWNEQDQVGGTIWGEFSKNKDHIVPFPKSTEWNASFTFEDYNKKRTNKEAKMALRTTNQTSGGYNGFPASNLENNYSFSTNEGLAASRLDMETWPDFPALIAAFSNGCTNKNHPNSTSPELMNDLSEAPKLNIERGKMAGYDHSSALLQCSDASAQKGTCRTVQLDGESELSNNDNFLDYDWTNIGDFDALDKNFRNDFIYGHDMVDKEDEFLSSCTNIFNGTSQSIPMPDLPSIRDQSSDQGSSFKSVEHSGRKRKVEEKTADISVRSGDQIGHCTHLSGECQGSISHFIEKEDKQKLILKPQIAKEKNKSAQNLNGAWSDNTNHEQQSQSTKIHPSIKLQTFQSPTMSLQRQVGDMESLEHPHYNESEFSGYGYSTLHIPAYSLIPKNHAERNQIEPVSFSRRPYPDTFRPSNYSAKSPDIPSRLLSMTPQEKIEKLRRRQQMQAILAIQKQQQQFVHQTIATGNLFSQACLQKNQSLDDANVLLSSDPNILVPHDECQSFPLINDHPLEETIYYQLQDTLRKLDTGARLCIRDSLFRLARSAVERQSISDRSSISRNGRDEDEVLANEETNNQNRYTRLQDVETYTNPTDRAVAHLLFYRASDSCARSVKEEIPQSPTSGNPGQIHGVKSEGLSESFKEMEGG